MALKYMVRNFLLLILSLTIVSCNNFGSRKIKNINELTPLLSINSNEQITVNVDLESPFKDSIKSYAVAKSKIISNPVFAKGTLYSVDSKGVVTAFSVKEKRILWSQDVAGKIFDKSFVGGGVAYNNEKLFVTNGSRFLIILNAKTGHELKRKEFPDIIRNKPVLLSEKEVIIQTISNQVFDYNVDTANMVWQHEGIVETLTSRKHIDPIIYNDKVIISYSSGQMVNLEGKTGQEIWRVNLANDQDLSLPNFDPSSISCQPIIEGNNIYVSSSTNKITKLNAENGQVVWQIDASDIKSMSLNGNNLFTTNNAKQIVALSTIDGKIKWISDLDFKLDRHKAKAASFLNPLVLKNANGWELAVIDNIGGIYSFAGNNGNLETTPILTKIMKNAEYSGVTCCGNIYIIADNKALFFKK